MQIDTSTVATHMVDYVVTDQNGLTSTSTRTIIVEPTDTSPSDPESTVTRPVQATTTSIYISFSAAFPLFIELTIYGAPGSLPDAANKWRRVEVAVPQKQRRCRRQAHSHNQMFWRSPRVSSASAIGRVAKRGDHMNRTIILSAIAITLLGSRAQVTYPDSSDHG